MDKVVFVHTNRVKKIPVFVADYEEKHECPRCGNEIKLGKNQFKCRMKIERIDRGWYVHSKNCKND